MKEWIGSPGSVSGLLLRLGQCLFAGASIGVMVSATGYYKYNVFIYLIVSMAIQVLWSFGIACLDINALRIKRDLQNLALVSVFVAGDWATATLSLAAACSSAGVMVLFTKDIKEFCVDCNQLACSRIQISIALSFITWFLIALSSQVMLCILASL